jgi:hypothetical protein
MLCSKELRGAQAKATRAREGAIFVILFFPHGFLAGFYCLSRHLKGLSRVISFVFYLLGLAGCAEEFRLCGVH